jgi:hypothetical protein
MVLSLCIYIKAKRAVCLSHDHTAHYLEADMIGTVAVM